MLAHVLSIDISFPAVAPPYESYEGGSAPDGARAQGADKLNQCIQIPALEVQDEAGENQGCEPASLDCCQILHTVALDVEAGALHDRCGSGANVRVSVYGTGMREEEQYANTC